MRVAPRSVSVAFLVSSRICSTEEAVEAIIQETAVEEITERGATRMDDQTSEASMERRKREGYF